MHQISVILLVKFNGAVKRDMAGVNEKRTTIKDVAEFAGVTPAVVSRVFNNDETLNIKDETRLSVKKAIKALNYVPNSVARSLRTQTSSTIGVLISDITNPFFTEVIKGVQSAAFDAGYTVMLCDTTDNSEEEKKHIEKLRSQSVDGVILGSVYVEDDVVNLLEKLDLKYVMVNRGASNSKAPYVKSEDIEGIADVVNYLIKMGHKKIGYLSGPLYADTAIRRLSGYRRALLEANVPYNSKYIVETMFDEQSGYTACKELLEYPDRPTAICAANDMSAIGAVRAIREAGLSIPEDISITGFNDIWVSSKLTPALTTVHCGMYEMGRKAFELLLDIIKGANVLDHKCMMPTSLVIRDSVKNINN